MNTSTGRRKATVPNCLHPPPPPRREQHAIMTPERTTQIGQKKRAVSDETKIIFLTAVCHANLFLLLEECYYPAVHSDMPLLMTRRC